MVKVNDITKERLEELTDLEALKKLAIEMFGREAVGDRNIIDTINVYNKSRDKKGYYPDKYPMYFSRKKIVVSDEDYLESAKLFAERAEEIIKRRYNEQSSQNDIPCSFEYEVIADFSSAKKIKS